MPGMKPARSPMKWLLDSTPISRLPNNPRHLSPRLLQAREISLSNPPAEISSKDLPSNVRFHIMTELQKHDLRHRKPWLDPRIAQNGQYLAQPNPIPERLFDEQKNELVSVYNPFLTLQYPVDNFSPMQTNRVKLQYRQPIKRQEQVRLAAKYPPHLLPPSHVNPIANPPRIRWDRGSFKGTLVTWEGTWEPKVRKGIYHNRGKIFKGTKKERERVERDAEIAERVAGMDERIAKWREQKRREKLAARPQLPF